MSAVPEDFATLTPTLAVKDAAKAIELYKKAFGAEEIYCMNTADGKKVMHACLSIGTSKLFIADLFPEMGCGTPSVSAFYVYQQDVNASFKKATDAGLKELYPVSDMFWGDRTGTVEDPFGIRWTLATHVRDVSPEEMEEAKKNWSKKAA